MSFQRLGITALTAVEYVLVTLDGLEIMVEKKIITYICLVEQKDCNCLSEKLIFSDKSCIIEKIVQDSFQVVWLGKSCKTVDELNYGPAK